jgi:hypothetical protein
MIPDVGYELLVLHAVRIRGFADIPTIAGRFGLDPARTTEILGDAQAYGWVVHTVFADLDGWSLTESGRAENERRLAVELAGTGGADEVREVYRGFLPLNTRLRRVCTDWQLRPVIGDRFAVNDHFDRAWDDRVLAELAVIGRALAPIIGRLSEVLDRFRGYDTRFTAALHRAQAGESGWVDGTDIDSCHHVWFELHEDLIATLGLDRGAAASGPNGPLSDIGH